MSVKAKASHAPVYAAMYPDLAEIAREHGYALAIHGSLQRDFDLVALPWTDTPSFHEDFLGDICEAFQIDIVSGPAARQHGRIVYTLSISFGGCFIDLSFFPAVGEGMKAVCELLGFDPTNHHNAARCPYCNPTEKSA